MRAGYHEKTWYDDDDDDVDDEDGDDDVDEFRFLVPSFLRSFVLSFP